VGQVRGRASHVGSSEDVDEVTLADRVRSQLGPLEKRLDLPRVLVTVEGTTVKLHGEVPSSEDARTLENAAREVRGVTALESHLAVGLSSGATRPSESRPV
jgi:osmotically-inducible protein OsmY